MFPPFWLALVVIPQQHDAAAEPKQLTVMVGQIRRLAASEPLVFGIDTRLRTAQVLTGKYPKIARDLLRDAEAATAGLTAPDEQDQMRVRIVELMAPLDL